MTVPGGTEAVSEEPSRRECPEPHSLSGNRGRI